MFAVENHGYEGKFDFPHRAGRPALVYMLASVPRTGSSHLSHLLWQSGCLGAPLEYLNFQGGPLAFAAGAPDLQQWLWRSLQKRRTSPNGVFGFKAFPSQLQALHEANPALNADVMGALRPDRFIHLARRNRAAHVASFARAILSGEWRKEQEGSGAAADLGYSQVALENADRILAGQEAAWEEMFAALRIVPLRLWYEDVVADPAAAVARVAAHLRVQIDPAAAVAVPMVEKQSSGGTGDWAARYAQSRTG